MTTEVATEGDVNLLMHQVAMFTEYVYGSITGGAEGPLDLLYRLKFTTDGYHPVHGHAVNVIEQINQTWSWIAALEATRLLLRWHPDAGGFTLAPDAAMSQPLDIMSEEPGLVGAEVFAAVHPRNNRKLVRDLAKLGTRTEAFRYVFFLSPAFPTTQRQEALERDGVEVWSVDYPRPLPR